MLNPGIPNMNILEVMFMVSINAINGQNIDFWPFMAFMDTMKITSSILTLGIPVISMKNVVHQ